MDTLIILDWDDTLFPTSWVVKNKINLRDARVKSKLSFLFGTLDKILKRLLTMLLSHGDVIIITNAMPEWVDTSLTVLPMTEKIMREHIDVVSARKLYQYRVETIDWKKHAFRTHFSKFYQDRDGYQNIISAGDAEYERRALIHLYGWDNHQPGRRFLKTIKFMKGPTFTSLIDQLVVITGSIGKVISVRKHVELHFDQIAR